MYEDVILRSGREDFETGIVSTLLNTAPPPIGQNWLGVYPTAVPYVIPMH